MNKHHHNFCKINLVVFLGSFVFFALMLFNGSSSLAYFDNTHSQVHQKNTQVGPGSVQQPSEELEIEIEQDFVLSSIILPFSVALQPMLTFRQPESAFDFSGALSAAPIYLSACNFRI